MNYFSKNGYDAKKNCKLPLECLYIKSWKKSQPCMINISSSWSVMCFSLEKFYTTPS